LEAGPGRLIETWLGIQQSIIDQTTVSSGEFALMHVSKPKEAFSTQAMMCYSTTFNNLM